MQTLFRIRELHFLIPKKCGYLLVIMMMLAGQIQALASDKTTEAVSVQQQQITVTGVVTDTQGDPMPGVNVMVKGTTIGFISDSEGKFIIAVPNERAVLTFSFLGFAPQEIVVGSNRNLTVSLSEDSRLIEEVVVVGYGTQKKATLTGSVVAVQSKELATTKSTNVQNMLTGKLPGLRNIQKTSEPGQFTNVFDIRGMGSPLIIVDGVPRSDFPRMDANDIESVSILKDASAAIYGVRGANGVVLVTTKSGEKGKAKIEYSAYYGIQTPAEMLKPVSAYDRALLYNETTMRNRTSPILFYSDDYFNNLNSGVVPDVDWYKVVLNNTAPQQQHDVTVSGGSDKVDYHINLGYTDQGSFFVTNSSTYQRYNLRANLNAQITNHLKAGVKLNYITDERNQANMWTDQIYRALWRVPTDNPVYANEELGYYYRTEQEYNPRSLIDTDLSGKMTYKKNILQSNLSLDYSVPYIDGLKARFLFSYDKTYDDNTEFQKEYNEYRYNANDNTYSVFLRNNPSKLTRRYQTWLSTFWNASLNYNKTFAERHNVAATLIYEERYAQDYWFSAQREFVIPVPYIYAGKTENQNTDGSGLNEYALRSVIGRLNYDYSGKYMAEFAFRYDGNSKFPKNSRWGFFPSVLLAYRLSEESFIKNNLFWLQNLKLRGSWGQSGDESASNFEFVEGFDYPASGQREKIPRGYVFGNTFVNGLGFRNAPNLNLTWYTSTMKNIGLDVDVLKRLFGFSVDFFQRDRDGLMAKPDVLVPGSFGAGMANANLDSDRFKGFELELRHHNKVNRDFQYNITGFMQMTRRMWTKKTQTPYGNSYAYWRNSLNGRYNDVWFLYQGNGQFQNWNDIANSLYTNANTLPGDPIYEDWNGDGVIDDRDLHPVATVASDNDSNLPGSNNTASTTRNYPLMSFGATMGGQWKGFDLNLLFQGSTLSSLGYTELLYQPMQWNSNAVEYNLDRWRPADPKADPYNPNTAWISGFYPDGSSRAYQNSTFNIQDGTYLRLKSAEIGFTVPKNIVSEKLGVKNLRLYVNAYNLFTFTGVKSLDPEKPTESGGNVYPLNRTFNFGGSITF